MIVTDPLRIGFVSLHTSPLADPGQADAGGMNVFEYNTARALALRGHSVDMYTRRTDTDTATIVEVAERVRLIHLPAGPSTPLAKSAMEIAIEPFRNSLAEAMVGTAYDVLHCHHWFSGVAALPVARQHGVATVQSFHSVAAPVDAASPAAGEPAESSGRIAGELLASTQADLVVAVSQAEAGTIQARYPVDPEKIAIVLPGVDVAQFHPAAAPSQSRYLLFAARLQPLKGPDLAMKTLAALPPALDDVRLVLAGAASADFASFTAELRSLAAELGVADRVVFAGPQTRPQLAGLMREASVFLLPSWSETFGLVALESEASGVPVVAWRGAGGPPEAIPTDGGVLLDSRDPADWADACAGLLSSNDGWAALSAAARSFAEAHTWDATAAGLENAYARVVPGDR